MCEVFASGSSAIAKQYYHDPKFKGSNPISASLGGNSKIMLKT
jgi:hypothetical protein